ncbi:MAG TPA: hypothetical protein VM553_16050 [Dongiaceae bacterium]|nr:hypothetical protein [Dongiaceae bacterium]
MNTMYKKDAVMLLSNIKTLGFWSCAVLVALTGIWINHDFYHDDAYISLRYSENFLNGLGLVWNPSEHVQGYTNFLFVMLVYLLGYVGMDLVLASKLLGMVSFVGLIVLVLISTRFFSENTIDDTKPMLPEAKIGAWVLLTSLPLITWAMGGLESVTFTFFICAGVVATQCSLNSERQLYWAALSGLIFGLAYLLRPDGAVFGVVSGGYLLYSVWQKRAGWAVLPVFSLAVLVIVVPYSLWQLSFYGDILPNTYHAKSGAPLEVRVYTGFKYLAKFLISPPFLPAITLLLVFHTWRAGRLRQEHIFLLACCVVFGAYLFSVGGDHMQAFRMMLPIIPLMALLIGGLAPLYFRKLSVRQREIVFALFFIVSAAQLRDINLSPALPDPAADVGKVVGEYINEHWPDNSLVALHTAGSTPYYAPRLQFIDMLGLNDATIARRNVTRDLMLARMQWAPGHLKGDGAYVLNRRPDYIIAGPAEGSLISDPWFLSDVEMANSPEFKQHYRLEQAELPQLPTKVKLFTYYRRIDNREEARNGLSQTNVGLNPGS